MLFGSWMAIWWVILALDQSNLVKILFFTFMGPWSQREREWDCFCQRIDWYLLSEVWTQNSFLWTKCFQSWTKQTCSKTWIWVGKDLQNCSISKLYPPTSQFVALGLWKGVNKGKAGRKPLIKFSFLYSLILFFLFFSLFFTGWKQTNSKKDWDFNSSGIPINEINNWRLSEMSKRLLLDSSMS